MNKVLIGALFTLVLTLGLLGQARAEDVFSQNLSFGIIRSPEVTKLQEFLTDQGLYFGPISGNFFSLTLRAVKSFQTQQGISPASGYFGPLTRSKANALANTDMSASNQQAVAETGNTPPPPASSSAQLQLEALLKQIAILQAQFQTQTEIASTTKSLQDQITGQNQTLQQIQQNTQQIQSSTQQIQQNTTPTTPSNPCGIQYPNCNNPSSNDYYLARGMQVPGSSQPSSTVSQEPSGGVTTTTPSAPVLVKVKMYDIDPDFHMYDGCYTPNFARFYYLRGQGKEYSIEVSKDGEVQAIGAKEKGGVVFNDLAPETIYDFAIKVVQGNRYTVMHRKIKTPPADKDFCSPDNDIDGYEE